MHPDDLVERRLDVRGFDDDEVDLDLDSCIGLVVQVDEKKKLPELQVHQFPFQHRHRCYFVVDPSLHQYHLPFQPYPPILQTQVRSATMYEDPKASSRRRYHNPLHPSSECLVDFGYPNSRDVDWEGKEVGSESAWEEDNYRRWRWRWGLTSRILIRSG